MTIAFLHIRDTRNIGDRYCSPYDYFDWADADVRDIDAKGSPYDVGIYGGGRIFTAIPGARGVCHDPGVLHIAWGVGTLQRRWFSLKNLRARRFFALVGSRDWGDHRFIWAPCVSCMSPLFDALPNPTCETVFYYHKRKTSEQKLEIPAEIPSMSNEDGNLQDAISFLASGETVVSNSYHGVYWGLLLGRRVICIPFSEKFSAYRIPPFYSTPENWRAELSKATNAPEFLDLCRHATNEFADVVAERIRAHGRHRNQIFDQA